MNRISILMTALMVVASLTPLLTILDSTDDATIETDVLLAIPSGESLFGTPGDSSSNDISPLNNIAHDISYQLESLQDIDVADIAIDAEGNSYVVGSFSRSATFGSFFLSTATTGCDDGGTFTWFSTCYESDGFIAKQDVDGNWAWALDFDTAPLSVVAVSTPNLYAAGIHTDDISIAGLDFSIGSAASRPFTVVTDVGGNVITAGQNGCSTSSCEASISSISLTYNGGSYQRFWIAGEFGYRVNFTNPSTDGAEYLYELTSEMSGFIMAGQFYAGDDPYINWKYAEDLEGTAFSKVSAIDAYYSFNCGSGFGFIGFDSGCDYVYLLSDFKGELTIGSDQFTSVSNSWDVVISKILVDTYDSGDTSDYVTETWTFNFRLPGSSDDDYGGDLFQYNSDLYVGTTYLDSAYFRKTSISDGSLLSSHYLGSAGSTLDSLTYYLDNGQEVVVGAGTFSANSTDGPCEYNNPNPTATDGFIAMLNLSTQDCEWALTMGTFENDSANSIAVGGNPFKVMLATELSGGTVEIGDQTFTTSQPSSLVSVFTRDADGDGRADSNDVFDLQPTQWGDADSDGFGDQIAGYKGDDCPASWGLSWRDRYGCPDMDGDGQSDLNDMFMQDDTQWDDTDGDGLGDNYDSTNPNSRLGAVYWPGSDIPGANLIDPSPLDFDNDGFEDEAVAGASSPYDDCVIVYGLSKAAVGDRNGCPDSDGDYYSDPDPGWPAHPTGTADAFPGESSQWHDADADGFGDSADGFRPDSCTETSGASTMDAWGCLDTDGDGWSDDSGGRSSDQFDSDSTQWSDEDGDGYGDNPVGTDADACPYAYGDSLQDRLGCPDADGDGWSDADATNPAHGTGGGADADSHKDDSSQWRDQDGDGYGDNASGTNADDCPAETGTSLYALDGGLNRISELGCLDSDNDGMRDTSDACPSQFGTSTIDQWNCPDSDGDGYSNAGDDCTYVYGSSDLLGTFGCPDADEDGIADQDDPSPYDGAGSENDWDGDGVDNGVDALPSNPTQTEDGDGDGYGDNASTGATQVDAFPLDDSQWADYDGDGYGDRSMGNNPDSCIFDAGTSTQDRKGCADTDGDGYSDSSGSWWAHPLGMADSHPNDVTQYRDSDGDAYGDNPAGNESDSCNAVYGKSRLTISGSSGEVEAYFGCIDSDSDGYADATDLCPYQWGNSIVDRYACPDSDQDGISDGNDPLPYSATGDVEDWDGDGALDHAADAANNSDAFPTDSTQWSDQDGDQFGDNPNGTDPDQYILDGTQWSDNDGDGYGDNPLGTTPDDCPNEAGTSSHKSARGCLDSDGDGVGDEWDAFPTDSLQTKDSDDDGYGDDHVLDENGEDYGDDCKDTPGTSWIDRYGCEDQDNDGYSNQADDCVGVPGFSVIQLTGCPDSDSDGIPDMLDPVPDDGLGSADDWDGDGYNSTEDDLPLDPTQSSDIDGDGRGDDPAGNEPDSFPEDQTQWMDADGDGFGDNPQGNLADACPAEFGDSSHELTGLGCSDRDGDGMGDIWDAFPDEPTQTLDSDGDGFGNNNSQGAWKSDFCIDEEGTSFRGMQGCPDEDGDGFADDADECPDVPGLSSIGLIGCPDSDGDGIPDDLDEYIGEHGGTAEDFDGDGVLNANDAFPTDRTQNQDSDQDGFGDNQSLGATNPDMFPSDDQAWSDSDMDGWTDQLNTENTDDCPSIPGSSSSPWRGCPDMDGDGIMDLADEDADGDGITNSLELQAGGAEKTPYNAYDSNSTPSDLDKDGIPDSLDSDDDDDGFPDELEDERGSDSMDAQSTPLTLYGEGDTGFYYVPGEGFSSEYSRDGFEVSMSAVMSLITSEYLAPLLLLPVSVILLLRKRMRFRSMRKRLSDIDDDHELKAMEEMLDRAIEKGRVKVEHGLLLRNQYERVKDRLGDKANLPTKRRRGGAPPKARGGGDMGQAGGSVISSRSGGPSRPSSRGGMPPRGR